MLSELIKTMIIDGVDTDDEIPLPNVKGDILAKVIEFCEHYAMDPMTEFEKVNYYNSYDLIFDNELILSYSR